MYTKNERRAICTAYRLRTMTGEEQFRAFDRLEQLAGMEAAFDVWLSTKPDPVLVETIIQRYLFDWLKASPIRTLFSRKNMYKFPKVTALQGEV